MNNSKNNGNYTTGITIRLRKKFEKNPYCKICQLPSEIIHHLDLDKKNNNWNNLFVMCNKCHNNLHQRGYNFRKTSWKIRVTEIFTSIQGEGDTQGEPAHFIRLFGCNLNCLWCDSDYSKNNLVGSYTEYDYLKILELIKRWKKSSNVNRVVITGGEPLLQNIIPLLMLLKMFDYKVEIETNGTVPKHDGRENLIQKIYKKELVDKFNISPKLKGSQKYIGPGMGLKLVNWKNIEQFKDFNYIVKFVVENNRDLKNALEVQRRCKIPSEKIWLMPKGDTKDKQIKNTPAVIDMCMKYNFKLASRLHILVWDKKRGV